MKMTKTQRLFLLLFSVITVLAFLPIPGLSEDIEREVQQIYYSFNDGTTSATQVSGAAGADISGTTTSVTIAAQPEVPRTLLFYIRDASRWPSSYPTARCYITVNGIDAQGNTKTRYFRVGGSAALQKYASDVAWLKLNSITTDNSGTAANDKLWIGWGKKMVLDHDPNVWTLRKLQINGKDNGTNLGTVSNYNGVNLWEPSSLTVSTTQTLIFHFTAH